MKGFDIKFEFPAVYQGYYDCEHYMSYVFGKQYDAKRAMETINHETIHYVIHKLTCPDVSEDFDDMREIALKRDYETYKFLY